MNYGIGDTIHVKSLFGGTPFRVRVTARHDDIKNNRPGFEGVAADGEGVWGFDSQIRGIDRAPLAAGMAFTHNGMDCIITGVGGNTIRYDSGTTHHVTTVDAFRALHAAGLIALAVA